MQYASILYGWISWSRALRAHHEASLVVRTVICFGTFCLLCYPGAQHDLASWNVVFRTNDSDTYHIWIAHYGTVARALDFLHLSIIRNENKQVVCFSIERCNSKWLHRTRAHSSWLSLQHVLELIFPRALFCLSVCVCIFCYWCCMPNWVSWMNECKIQNETERKSNNGAK